MKDRLKRYMRNLGDYILNILIAIDQLFNVILLKGRPDHTISGRVGYKSYTTKKWYWRWSEKVINTIFWWDDNHCYNSIEWDEIK